MTSPPHALTLALKEWAAVCLAVDREVQTLLLRKGGCLVKPQFTVEGNPFALYPTLEHQNAAALQPRHRPLTEESQRLVEDQSSVMILNWAKVESAFEVWESTKLLQLQNECVWKSKFVEQQFQRRQQSPLNVLLLRVHRLKQPRVLIVASNYRGCKSCVDLEDEVPIDGSKPVLSDSEFNARAEWVKRTLSQI